MPRPRKSSDELRERAVRLVFESGRPIAHVAADLGIHRESLRGVVRQAEADVGERHDRLRSAERDRFSVELICHTLGVSASAYYQRRAGSPPRRRVEDTALVQRIPEVHAADSRCYGYRRTWLAVRRDGVEVGLGTTV
jgi:transposase-like protein